MQGVVDKCTEVLGSACSIAQAGEAGGGQKTLGGVGHCFAWQGTRPTGGVGENYPVRCSAVREAQNRLLCQAFLFVFYGLPNIFRQKSGYFLQYLQFKFLVWWLSKVSNFGENINF